MAKARFRVGEPVRLWLPEPAGDPLLVTVDVVERSRVWVLAPDAPLEAGHRVLLERAVPDDARYQGLFEVCGQVRDSLALARVEDWRRVQDRSFVRVATGRVDVEAIPGGGEPGALQLRMLDLSAGGMRVETRMPLTLRAELDCRFRLTDSTMAFSVPARVVRVLEKLRRGPPQAGLEFLDLPYPIATELTRWVFQEQIRRRNG